MDATRSQRKRSAVTSAKVPPTTTATTTTTIGKKRPIVNPYARNKPFIGGAEEARRAARKKARGGGMKILTPMERQRLDEVLPIRMNPMERFCAALLRSSAAEFVQSESSPAKGVALWKTTCRRVGLQAPETPLLPRYDRSHVHFALRAALVLEEARHTLAQPLAARWNQMQRGKRVPGIAMVLKVQHFETNQDSGHARVVLRKEAPFTRDELYHLRTATVLECQVRDGPRTIDAVQLAVIFSSNRGQVEAKREFSATFFRQLPSDWKGCEILVRPVETLVTTLRSFEAMTVNPDRVAFLHNLMGVNAATHTRFDDNGVATKSQVKSLSDYFPAVDTTPKTSSIFRLPTLNATQEKASAAFLKSKPNTLTLIQGPPGEFEMDSTVVMLVAICTCVSP